MRTLKILTHKDEALANRLIRDKKTATYTIFYHSEWDKWSNRILALAEEWAQGEGDEECYVVSSWELPHLFSAFGITSAPSVVKVRKGNVKVFVEYPRIYEYFMPPKAQTPE